jgi:hypothetical protein
VTWLFGAEPGRRLRLVHSGLAVVIGARIALGPYPGLAGQPAALFRPRSFLTLLDQMPSRPVIVAVQVVGVLGVLAAVVTRRGRRPGFLLAWLALLFLAGLRTSLGKILHNDVLLLLVAVPFLPAPVDAEWDDTEPSPRWGWPVRGALAVTAAAYLFSGVAKLRHSGLTWVTGDNIRYVMQWAGVGGRGPTGRVAFVVADHAWLAHATGAFILGVELTFPLVLVWPATRRWYAAGAVLFHVGTYFTLGIDYWSWAAVDLLVVAPWWAASWRKSPPGQVPTGVRSWRWPLAALPSRSSTAGS